MRPKWGPDSRVSLSVSENRDVSTKKGPVRDVCVSQKGCSLVALMEFVRFWLWLWIIINAEL